MNTELPRSARSPKTLPISPIVNVLPKKRASPSRYIGCFVFQGILFQLVLFLSIGLLFSLATV